MKKNNHFGHFQITNNLPLKLISLIFAILLWIFVMDTENPIIEREISGLDIHYINKEVLANKNIDMSSTSVDTISVVIFGKRDKIVKLDKNSIVPKVDLKSASPGTQNFNVEVTSPDAEIFIKSISDTTISISFDSISKKKFAIEKVETGKMPENRILHHVEQEISEVELHGPKRYLESVDKVFAVLDMTQLNQSNEVLSPILIVDKNGREISELTPNFKIQKFTCAVYKNASIPVNYEIIGELGSDFRIDSLEIEPKHLKVYGEVKKIEALEKSDNKFIIDVSQVKESMNLAFSSKLLSEDIRVDQLPRLSLKVDEYIERTFTLTNDNIDFIDLNTEYEVDLLTDFGASFKVYGEKNEINALNSGDFKLMVSLKNLNIGEYTLEGRLNNYNFKTLKYVNEDQSMTDNYKIANISAKISKKNAQNP